MTIRSAPTGLLAALLLTPSCVHATAQTAPGALVNAARALIRQEKYVEALPKLNEAIKARPDYAAAYQDRATALFQLKRFPEALKDLDTIVRLRPRAPAGYFNRGIVLLNLPTPDYERALDDFSRVIELNPGPNSTSPDRVQQSYLRRAFALEQLARTKG